MFRLIGRAEYVPRQVSAAPALHGVRTALPCSRSFPASLKKIQGIAMLSNPNAAVSAGSYHRDSMPSGRGW